MLLIFIALLWISRSPTKKVKPNLVQINIYLIFLSITFFLWHTVFWTTIWEVILVFMPQVLATLLGINFLRLYFYKKNKTTLLKSLENIKRRGGGKSPVLLPPVTQTWLLNILVQSFQSVLLWISFIVFIMLYIHFVNHAFKTFTSKIKFPCHFMLFLCGSGWILYSSVSQCWSRDPVGSQDFQRTCEFILFHNRFKTLFAFFTVISWVYSGIFTWVDIAEGWVQKQIRKSSCILKSDII